MVEWKQRPSGMLSAECGDLALEAWNYGPTSRAWVSVVGEPLLDAFDYPTLDAAQLAAETFAREWVAKQAAALGDGWIPVGERLPEDDRHVLVFISAPHAPYCYGIGSYGPMNGPRWRSRDILFPSHFVSHWQHLPTRPVKP